MSTLTEPSPPPPSSPYRTPRPLRRALAVAAGVLALALVAHGAFTLLDLAARTTTVERTSYAGVGALVVEGGADIRLTSAPAGGRVEVAARITEGLRAPEHRIVQQGDGTLRLSASCAFLFTGQCRVRFDLRVPAGTTVRARTGAGDIDVRDLRSTAPVVLHSSAGDITASGASAPALDLSSSAGDVDAGGVRAARVRVRSSAGDVNVALREPADRLDAGSSAGDIELVVPDAIYRLDAGAGAGAGDVSSADVRTDPASRRILRARTSAGDISIRIDR